MARAQPKILREAIRVDEAERAYRAIQRTARQVDLELAAQLASIKKNKHYTFTNCASIGEYAERNGDSEYYARRMVNLHEATTLSPELRRMFLEGAVSHDAAVAVGQLLRRPRLILQGEDWVEAAVRLTTPQLIRLVRQRQSEVRTGAPTVPLVVYLSPEEKSEFLRAKKLVARNKRHRVTEAEAVVELIRFYRKHKDPLCQAEGTRRMPDTKDLPGRGIPASVRRAVARLSEDRCEVPTCNHEPFLDYTHSEPHSEGGSREADNLGRRCRIHHILQDYGLMRVEGPPGAPIFYDREGNIIGGKDPPEPKMA